MEPRASLLSVHMMRAALPALIIKEISLRQRVILILMGTYTINSICPTRWRVCICTITSISPSIPLVSSYIFRVLSEPLGLGSPSQKNSGSRQIVFDLFNFKQGTEECIAETRVGSYVLVRV